jgi:hypothetical protein
VFSTRECECSGCLNEEDEEQDNHVEEEKNLKANKNILLKGKAPYVNVHTTLTLLHSIRYRNAYIIGMKGQHKICRVFFASLPVLWIQILSNSVLDP